MGSWCAWADAQNGGNKWQIWSWNWIGLGWGEEVDGRLIGNGWMEGGKLVVCEWLVAVQIILIFCAGFSTGSALPSEHFPCPGQFAQLILPLPLQQLAASHPSKSPWPCQCLDSPPIACLSIHSKSFTEWIVPPLTAVNSPPLRTQLCACRAWQLD